jgi:hypothetical protein
MLIDTFLPDYDFNEVHAIDVRATANAVSTALREVDFGNSFVIRWLLRLRGMSGTNISFESMRGSRFEMLGVENDREVVFGLIGKFWKLRGNLQKIDKNAFCDFKTRGFAKAAWNFSLDEKGAETKVTTETRIKCLDEDSRRRFGFYWTFVRPFSGLIRMEMLRVVKECAESKAQ